MTVHVTPLVRCCVLTAAPFQSTSGSISFGTSAVDYSTTTSDATRRPEAVYEGKRQVNVQKTSFQLGDDAVDFVSTRMAEEGLQTRQKATRYKPVVSDDSTSKATAALLGTKSGKSAGAPSSWSLGSAQWEPSTSAGSSFSWPDTVAAVASKRGECTFVSL